MKPPKEKKEYSYMSNSRHHHWCVELQTIEKKHEKAVSFVRILAMFLIIPKPQRKIKFIEHYELQQAMRFVWNA